MVTEKNPDKQAKKRTRPDPVSLYPLDFEEALRGILEAGPHVEPDEKPQKQQKQQDAAQPGKKNAP
jgi:hypothetical protein